jgi:hypothetical protein
MAHASIRYDVEEERNEVYAFDEASSLNGINSILRGASQDP